MSRLGFKLRRFFASDRGELDRPLIRAIRDARLT
jgi:hypothetical protein